MSESGLLGGEPERGLAYAEAERGRQVVWDALNRQILGLVGLTDVDLRRLLDVSIRLSPGKRPVVNVEWFVRSPEYEAELGSVGAENDWNA